MNLETEISNKNYKVFINEILEGIIKYNEILYLKRFYVY